MTGDERITVSAYRGKQAYHFRYSHGEEALILDAIDAAAKNPHSRIDWLDAMVLSAEVNDRLSKNLETKGKE